MKFRKILSLSFWLFFTGISSTTVQASEQAQVLDKESAQASEQVLDKEPGQVSEQVQLLSNKDKLLEMILIQENQISSLVKTQNELISKNKILEEKTSDINLSTWISLLLGCVTVIITVLGVIVAILSILGYKNIKDSTLKASKEIAESTSSKIATDVVKNCIDDIAEKELVRIIDSGQLSKHLENAVDVIIRRENIYSEQTYPTLDIEEHNLNTLDQESKDEYEE
ncbi:hypothetical protein [Photobacterium damselae]|uniref:hypothetical protein n=1 Tax=Photobacterium damselae TaxID=38293 RepID=UPI000D9527AA|nr:hypothetical protein [Photobacterium damselae]NVO75042.1 hypothetical protein [Photobacterium damselae subsp. damselae]SPY25287.1 Uncharacterised protein [Photobacterium damselae]